MDKNFLGQIPLATVILAYIFVTGCLYLIGYWGIFGIDFISIASTTDICKGFTWPFILGNIYYIPEFLIVKWIEARKKNHIDNLKPKWNSLYISLAFVVIFL